MEKLNMKLIERLVDDSKNLPNPTIEYNFEELPKHKEIKADSFFGVKAVRREDLGLNKAGLIYKRN